MRYAAQRKLCLTKLLFDVDHYRSVRDGSRHRESFERLLRRSLWALQHGTYEVRCRNDGQACASGTDTANTQGAGGYLRFEIRHLALPGDEPDVDIYHERVRFKRDPIEGGELLGDASVDEGDASPCWSPSRRRSGSILSKMIRKGIGDPHLSSDILGAIFVVGDRRQVYALERTLVAALGGPLRWRERVDALSGERDRPRLDQSSAVTFRVFKQIVDVLVEDPSAGSPYLFPVEIQILPFGTYLRTRSGADFASHTAYKQRQFASTLLPTLFPPEIFGG